MISTAQSRAARGLLNWTQQDLASASGLSKTAINNFEKGNSDIKSESLRAIENAFQKGGVILTQQDGVRRKTSNMAILQGPNALTELLHDILETISADDEILFLNAEAHPPSQAEANQVNMYINDLNRTASKKRALCAKQTQSRYVTRHETRWLTDEFASLYTSLILYGTKTATLIWQSDMITLIESADITAAERARFEALWHNSQELSENKDAKIKRN